MRKLFLISTLSLVAFGIAFGAQKGSVKAKKQKLAREHLNSCYSK